MRSIAGLVVATGLIVGCSSNDARSEPRPDAMTGGRCDGVLVHDLPQSARHVPECSVLPGADEPPVGGDHYGRWAAFGAYAEALPRGFWIHNLEHGAVVFAYRCDEGCHDEVADAEALLGDLPADGACAEPRVLLTPDPHLERSWAAVAWGHRLDADCFDPQLFRAFYDAYVGQGPEDVCRPGVEFRAADGTLELPEGCAPAGD